MIRPLFPPMMPTPTSLWIGWVTDGCIASILKHWKERQFIFFNIFNMFIIVYILQVFTIALCTRGIFKKLTLKMFKIFNIPNKIKTSLNSSVKFFLSLFPSPPLYNVCHVPESPAGTLGVPPRQLFIPCTVPTLFFLSFSGALNESLMRAPQDRYQGQSQGLDHIETVSPRK